MHAVVIAGPKRSGKTALVALVAEALERSGRRVAVIKYSAHPLDRGNTDAFWLMRPGRVVVNASPGETAIFRPEEIPFDVLAARLAVDVIICEGGRVPETIPRILCFREDAEEEDSSAGEAAFAVIATYGDGDGLSGIPHFSDLDPAAAEAMAALVLEKGSLAA